MRFWVLNGGPGDNGRTLDGDESLCPGLSVESRPVVLKRALFLLIRIISDGLLKFGEYPACSDMMMQKCVLKITKYKKKRFKNPPKLYRGAFRTLKCWRVL